MTELFIRRPIATTLLLLGAFCFGVVGYFALPVSNMPNVDFPTIQVSVNFPGASPEKMASSVATPLERQFTTVPGLSEMTSVNTNGQTTITLQFALDRNLDGAASDVLAMINKAGGDLPKDLPNPPSFQKVNPADQPVLWLTLVTDSMPVHTLNDYAQQYVANRLATIEGVAQIILFGEQKFAVRVYANPSSLATYSLGLNDLVDAVQRENVNQPKGTLDGVLKTLTIQDNGQLMKAAEFAPVVVAARDGRIIRVEDVARVDDGVKDRNRGAFLGRKQTIMIGVKRAAGSNTLAVIAQVEKALPQIRQQLPAAIDLEVLHSDAHSISESVAEVKFTLVLAVVFVVLVIFVFLRDFRATIISGLAIPLSLVTAFPVMLWFGFNLDNLSLMALMLAVGFVVDDAVVVVENVVRHLDMGKTPLQASIDGAKEIGFTILSMTSSLAAVFIPLLYMGGILGRLFNEFAWTLVATIVLSGIVSIVGTPMMCSRLLKPSASGGHGHGPSQRGWLLRAYAASLNLVLRFRALTLLASVALLVFTGYLFVIIPKGFLPNDDRGLLIGYTEAQPGTSYDQMRVLHSRLLPILENEPDIDHVVTVLGTGDVNTALNNGFLALALKERSHRKESADALVARLRPKVNSLPGLRVFLMNPPSIPINTSTSKSLYQFALQGPDSAELIAAGQRLQAKLKALPQLQDVTSDLQVDNPEIHVQINRDKASYLGVTAAQVEDSLNSAYSGRQISFIYGATDTYRVIVELVPELKRDAALMGLLYVRSRTGALVPLDTVTDLERREGLTTVNHTGQFSSVTIAFNLAPGVALGDATAAVQKTADEVLPSTISGKLKGTAEAFNASLSTLPMLIVFALLVIYVILGMLYESFIHPITILSGLPSAAFGGLLTLLAFGKELDFYGIIGIIMLIGIVKKNAIMVIDFALIAERQRGLSPRDAVVEGCLERVRPIMMTTIAAVAGAVPIALALGGGAESRRPLGMVIVGGLVLSQVVTLYLTPVVYVFFESFKKPKAHQPIEPVPPGA